MVAPTNNDIPKISSSSTKKQIIDAFDQLKKQYEERQKIALEPEKVKEEKKKHEFVEVAEKTVSEGIDQKINDLKINFSNTLSELAKRLNEETEKYKQIKQAIEYKKNEFKEIYEIEHEASTLAAMLEAQRQKKEEFDIEMRQKRETFEREFTERKERLENEINTNKTAWEKEKAQYSAAFKESKEIEEKERLRSKEEFAYNFKRESEQKNNQLNDELQQLEKELGLKREEFEKTVTAKEGELHEREERIAQQEQTVNDLQREVENFPKRLEAKVQHEVEGISERLKLAAQNNERLLKAQFEGEKNVLTAKIEVLERLVQSQQKEIEMLSIKLEEAYGKVQDIAVKAVDSSAQQLKSITFQAPSPKAEE